MTNIEQLKTYEEEIDYKAIIRKIIGGFAFLFYMLTAGVIGTYMLQEGFWYDVTLNILRGCIVAATVGLGIMHMKMKDKVKRELLESESKIINTSDTNNINGADK